MMDNVFEGGAGWTRPGVLKTAAATSALAGTLPENLLAAEATKIGISVQLYSVRGDCGKDSDAALERITKMGLAGVEFASYHRYGGKAKELRKRLDDLKLTATALGLCRFARCNQAPWFWFHALGGPLDDGQRLGELRREQICHTFKGTTS
ncbi:MAG: hypothetical protein NTW87_06805 [Planctomycetota bacterium]|nr:hypothetical protein [Planctomycetota bacterium]